MQTLSSPAVDTLIDRISEAVELGDPEAITGQVKDLLEEALAEGGFDLPDRFRETRTDRYCRRLLYSDPVKGWQAIVMAWAPGQGTALHDHAGLWCVEGVLEGRIEVTMYERLEELPEDVVRFARRDRVQAGTGSAGALIPPFEYHVLTNAQSDRPAITLHVYGGEMDHCSIFEPQAGEPGDRYVRRERTLSFDA
jgi:3-mercaptopropionate dioxygenase